MDRVKALSGIDVRDIQAYLESCQQDFETSQLYSSSRDEKFTDEDLRKSVFRAITDTKLFDLVEDVVSGLDDSDYTYTLRRNDITHIKYEQGGFFKRHRDFLSTNSNLIEEYTLLLCVTPAEQAEGVVGGNTTIHTTFGGAKEFDTTTSGAGILFRKDLEHEGMELKRGQKHVITANIWATRTEQSPQVLLVTFPAGTASSKSSLSIDEVADESKSYVLPVDILSGMLKAHVEWANRRAEQEGRDEPSVVVYECRDFDHSEFSIVEKVLTRSYVQEQAVHDAKECLDYFGPFECENLLVNLSVEPVESMTVGAIKKELQGHGKSTQGFLEKSELVQALVEARGAADGHQSKKARTSKSDSTVSVDDDLIVCETEARIRAVASVAVALGATNYVPFKLLFVEGVMQSRMEADLGVVEVPMTAAGCLLGDHDNIFSLRKICRLQSTHPVSFRDIHSSNNVFQKIPAVALREIMMDVKAGSEIDLFDTKVSWDESGGGSNRAMYDVLHDLKQGGFGLGLKVGLKGNVKKIVLDSCLHEPYGMLCRDVKPVYLPGLDDGSKASNGARDCSLFHRNEKGEVVFTEEEAGRSSEFIANFGLEERVKAALQKKRFVLPQNTSEVESHFCNESVYGSINILWVCGLIRLDDSTKKAKNAKVETQEQEFDAWPSNQAKAETERDRSRYTQQIDFAGFGWW